MAKLDRKTQKLFGASGAAVGQFGSAQAGSPIISTDPDVIQQLSAYDNGWDDAVINGLKRPALEEFNGLNYVNTYQNSYLLQEGVAEYDASTTYYTGSLVKESGTSNIYKSIIDDNIGNALSNTASWSLLGDLRSSQNLVDVDLKSDLPDAIGGVITLDMNKTYFFTDVIDLTGDRLVLSEGTNIIGTSSENARIKSTGLIGTALITSEWSLPMRNISIEADIAVDLDASANANQAIDWFAVNFVDCGSIGTISTYNNFIMQSSAFLNSSSLVFDGTFGTIGFSACLFEGESASTIVTLPASLTITRRFRVIYSAFVTLSGEIGIDADNSLTIPDEAYILDNINFTGGGTYLSGILKSDNRSRFVNCRGIDNSANIAQYYMVGNATETVVSVGVYTKVLGSTTSGAFVERFDVTTIDNRAEYTGALSGFYKVTATLSAFSGNAKILSVRVAKNGTDSAQSTSISTTSSNGKSEGIVCQDIVELEANDYIEIFITNTSDSTNITVEDINIIIEKLN